MMLPCLRLRSIALGAAILLLSGCSTLGSIGSGIVNFFDFSWLRGSDAIEPNKLEDFDAEVSLRRVWSVNVGNGQGDFFTRLQPALDNGRIFAAANNGLVIAIDAENGRTLWRQRLEDDITGGVGFGGNLVLVASVNSRVFALDAETGNIRWESNVSSEVLAAPATDGAIVVVQSVDGKLTGLDAATGQQVWLYENEVPALTLRGTSSPLIVAGFVIAAFEDGSVKSVAVDNGTLRWDQRVAVPTGRSEIDRIVDIDGDLVIGDNGMLLVPSYQGYFAAIDPTTGQTRWRIENSSAVGATSGFGQFYAINDEDKVSAYRQNQETPLWENDKLFLRQLSQPLGFSNYLAVGDFEGYVHLLSQVDGRFVARTKVDGDGIRSHMLAQGNVLYVYGNSGNLVALRVQ